MLFQAAKLPTSIASPLLDLTQSLPQSGTTDASNQISHLLDEGDLTDNSVQNSKPMPDKRGLSTHSHVMPR